MTVENAPTEVKISVTDECQIVLTFSRELIWFQVSIQAAEEILKNLQRAIEHAKKRLN